MSRRSNLKSSLVPETTIELLRTSAKTVVILLNSSAPFWDEPALAAEAAAVALAAGVVTRLVPVVDLPPLAVVVALVCPVINCVSSVATSVALA